MITMISSVFSFEDRPSVRVTVHGPFISLSTRTPTGRLRKSLIVLFWDGDRWCEPSKLPPDTQKAWSKILGTPALSERLRGMLKRAGAPDLGR
jgi:hypothetical protein